MTDAPNLRNPDDLFRGALYDVEHAINMYATSFYTMPAKWLYEPELFKPYMGIIDKCHIYMIGYLPEMRSSEVKQVDRTLRMTIGVRGSEHHLTWPIPDGMNLRKDESRHFLQDEAGERSWLSEAQMQEALRSIPDLHFEVKYIGQAYGTDGGRNALDRLMKHETLQKISVKGVPEGLCLSVLFLEILPENRMFTVFNPFAQERDDGKRLAAGMDKLLGTSEKELVALFEASFIRYFAPEFNKEFKDSFPSTNMKVLKNCYDKDFAAVVAEICIDELPFRLSSETIEPALYHIAKHDLHGDDERRKFFSME